MEEEYEPRKRISEEVFFKSATDAAHKEQNPCSVPASSVILRDTVGLSSQTSQAETAPSLSALH